MTEAKVCFVRFGGINIFLCLVKSSFRIEKGKKYLARHYTCIASLCACVTSDIIQKCVKREGEAEGDGEGEKGG